MTAEEVPHDRYRTAEEVAHNRYMTAEEVAHNRYMTAQEVPHDRYRTDEEVAHNRYTGQLLRSIIAGGRDIVQCTLLSSTPRAHSELLGIMKTISKKQLDKIWGKNNSNDILMAAAGKKQT